MSYTPHVWVDLEGSEAQKITWLNNLETQYDQFSTYLGAFTHTNFYSKAEANAKYYRTPAHPSGRSDTGAGSGINASSLDNVLIVSRACPNKAIVMFPGTIPTGFKLCDGSYSTKDLREKYILGAGGAIANGATGGANSLTPTATNFNSPGHLLTDAELPAHVHTGLGIALNSDSTCTAGTGGLRRDATLYYRYVDSTYSNGISTRTAHSHDGCSFSWTGYKDAGGTTKTGALDNRPPSRAVKFAMRVIP